ncbi:MAG: ATP-binding protein [Lachnospiraceae bacterium]|nr:ATP-binding protein [Lachnospiraceae bacterium]
MSLSNIKYDAVLKIYQEKRIKARRLLEEHRSEVYDLIPSYKEIDDEIAELSIQHAKRLIQGDENVLLVLRDKLSLLFEEKKHLLKEFGFPENYLDLNYECPDCKDTGYIGQSKCHCLKLKLIEILYEQSNIKTVLERENFDFFSYDYYNDNETDRIKSVVLEAKKFIANFDSSYSNLLFFGDVGCGKTFLSNCIAKELLESGHSVIYFTSFQLFELIAKNTFYQSNQSSDSKALYEDIFNCDLLILDDLGTESINSFTTSQLFLILNERHLRKHATIISSNMSIQTLKDTYSERSISRILGNYELFLFKGEDIRPKKKKQENRK